MKFRVIKTFPHSTGYEQIAFIDESLFSAPKVVQEVCAFSIARPEAENFKEGDMLEVTL